MEIGTAGIPIDLAQSRDWGKIFSELASAGIEVFYPNSIYQEYPVSLGLGYEADFVPPPFGSATTEIYNLAREHGIKIAFSADILFPLHTGGVDASNSPLQAIIDAGGRDIIHSLANYDEAVWNGLDISMSKSVYEHVKSIDTSIQVVQVHAPVTSNDARAYLDAVVEHAQWADVVGFDVYPIGTVSGARTPQQPDRLVEPAAALQDYMAWLQAELGDHKHVMVLQGFQESDLYGANFDTALSGTSRAPTMLEMRELLIAVEDADMVFWWGPGLQADSTAPVWQNILTASEMTMSNSLGTPMASLTDINTAANGIAEDAAEGSTIGITLFADDPDTLDVVSYTLNDDRFKVGSDGVVTIARGATFDFETEPTVMVEGKAVSTDGTVSATTFEITVSNVIDVINGTGGADMLLGGNGADLIGAGSGNDLVDALGGDDKINAGRGDDQVSGGDGKDTIRGQDGDDILNGDAGNDLIEGGDGNDVLLGGAGSDYLDGGRGADQISGGDGDDTIRGQDGNDVIAVETGNNQVEGGIGGDVLYGGVGNDHLDGGAGADLILAGAGDNTIIGGAGYDQMLAGSGADRFVFGTDAGTDHIYAFDSENDTLVFDGMTQRSDLTINSYGSTVSIDYDGGNILLVGLIGGALDSGNFEFL